MYPDTQQKHILNLWFNAFNDMYNSTIIFLRKYLPYGFIRNYKNVYFENKLLNYFNGFLTLSYDPFLFFKR